MSEPAAAASTPATGPAAGTTGTDESGDWWILALIVLIAGGAVAFLLVRRAGTRRAWEAQLTSAEDEVGWFARDLIPQLRSSASPAAMGGGWAVAEPRVVALVDRLTSLASTAPGEEQRARATALRDAVRAAADRMGELTAAGAHTDWQSGMDDAQAPLLAALVPPPDPAAPGTPPQGPPA